MRGRTLVNLPPEAWILVRKPRPQNVRRGAGQFGGFAMGVTEALVLPDATRYPARPELMPASGGRNGSVEARFSG